MLKSSIATILQSDQLGQKVSVYGWVRSRRDSKAGISFLAISDGSCHASIQAVIPQDLPNYTSDILRLTKDCAVKVDGLLMASMGGGQRVEIQATQVEVLGWIEDPETYPISPKQHSMEHLREYAHLRPRTNIIGAVSRVRHVAAKAIHDYFDAQGLIWVNTPIITASDCEGAGELFRVSTLDALNPSLKDGKVDYAHDFFAKEAFLTVSGQLNAECYALALSKVYTFGPTFRAENSNTSRHLAEFWMVEPEIAFADLNDDATLAEGLIKHVITTVLNRREDDIAFFNQWVDKGCIARLQHVLDVGFMRMDYTDAIVLLEKSNKKFDYPVKWGLDLQSEHERYLCEEIVKGPVVLMNYPKEIKAFYMRQNADGKTVAAMDVLVPGIGELIGGSQREERLDVLDARIIEMSMNVQDYSWYRDLRRYGTVPHAGFGLGFERLLGYLTGVGNVRDLIPFPRVPGHATF
ncbi:MAG: asparagine--tRNA ligase [Gammaproteobacteria bacterium]|nr:asparagine--tRNA ligase [Gammaproteobacteria bacterium]